MKAARYGTPFIAFVLTLTLFPDASRAQSTGGVRRAGAESDAARTGAPFEIGKWYVGPRFWGASGWGGSGWGAQAERGWRQSGDGDNALGIGVSLDRFAPDGGPYVSYRIITAAGFVNYHFGLDEGSAFDPFVGIGLGYTNVSVTIEGSSISASGYNSGFLFNPRAGVRWFVIPRLALQADVGYGIGYVGFGGALKF